MMETYKKKLSPAEQKAFEQKLAEIKSVRGYFAKDKVGERRAVQEKSMSNLERDFNDKLIVLDANDVDNVSICLCTETTEYLLMCKFLPAGKG